MTFNTATRSALTGISLAAIAVALPSAASAQDQYPMSDAEVQALPGEYQTAPAYQDYTETTIGADGVETVTRTRRIESTSAYPTATTGHATYAQGYAPAGEYAPAAAVFQREEWIEECEDRTNGRGDREKGGIIGGLLGAIAGGIIGNRVSDSERLGGTLLGAGVGGLGGLLIGSLIGGGRNDRGDYDCEAALDSYLSQYGQPHAVPVRTYASRSIPAQGYYAAPAPAYATPVQYGYAPAYQSYSYHYAPPQQVVYVPVRYEQQQRVIVRETVREETYEVPGAARNIPAPQPAQPIQVKTQTPAPAPVQPRYVKGN